MKTSSPFFCVGESMEIMSRESHHLSKEMLSKIRERRFTVKDTGLTHRQINYLTTNDLMRDERESDTSWRRFSMKELIFLQIVGDLRKLGIKDKVLKDLHGAFFDGMCDRATDVMMFVALAGEKVYVTIDADGAIGFYNITMHQMYHAKTPLHINLNFNEYVLGVWNKKQGNNVEYKTEIQQLQEILERVRPTSQEQELLKLIQEKQYKSFTVKRLGKEDLLVKARSVTQVQEKELIDLIKSKEFADIQVVKRDGQVAHVAYDDTYKI